MSRRVETAQGWTVEAMHDAYVAPFGMRHERQITMSPQGLMVTGRDRLVPVEGDRRRGAAASPCASISIPMCGCRGWKAAASCSSCRAGRAGASVPAAALLEVEESVYLGGHVVRRAEQLVISGTMKDAPAEIAWVFEQIVA